MAEKVNAKSSKEAIWEALKDAQAKLNVAQGSKVDLAAETQAKKNATSVSRAQAVSSDQIEVKVANLQRDITKYLASVSSSLTEQIADLNAVTEAVVVKNQELTELLGMETEALSLAAIVSAKQALSDDFNAKHAERMANAQSQLDAVFAQINEAKTNWAEELRSARANLAQEQKRVKDEFEYNFSRETQKRRDEVQDSLDTLVKSHRENADKEARELQYRDEVVAKREQEVSGKEERLASLEAQVSNFPAQLQDAIAKAKEEGRKEAERTSAIKESYARKDFESTLTSHVKEIDLLKSSLDSERTAHQNTHAKLDAANERVQNIAIASVKGAAEAKVVVQQSPNDGIRK